jgi:hypothetical protein
MTLLNIQALDEPVREKDFPPLPEGWYEVVISQAEIREANNENGIYDYIWVEMTVTSGDYVNRRLWPVYSVFHPTLKTRKGQEEKAGYLVRALRLPKLSNVEELIKRCVQIRIYHDDKGQMQIANYKSAASTAESTEAEPAPPSGNGQEPAWAS